MSDLFSIVLPLFALIVAGFALRRSGFPGEAFWPGADRLNYFVLFPALLFVSLSHAPMHDPALARLALAILATIALASLGALTCRAFRGWPPARYGPLLQGAIRFNTYLGLAVVAGLSGKAGLGIAAVVIAVMVPTVNVLSVIALTAGKGVRPVVLLRSLAANPLIAASLLGIVCAASGLALPAGAERFLSILSAASLPLGLLCVGAALRPDAARAETPTLLLNSAFRLVAMPMLAFASARLLGVEGEALVVLVLFFALPTATSAYVLTTQLKGDAGLMAGLVTVQTLLSTLTLPLVLSCLT